jgi:octaprenyl-diphosphate synthase
MNKALGLLREDLAGVEELFRNGLMSEADMISRVGGHILGSGGKRIRPVLLMLCARLVGYSGSRHIALASAVEFIHTATLLHDDVVDGAGLRRGTPSANSVWGNQAAILAGDFLFARAFSMLVADGNLRVLEELSCASTLMAEGEMLQLMDTGDIRMNEERYLEIIGKKTAALFAATCRCGAILGGADAKTEAALHDFGMGVGLAFQLVDDALDYVGEEAEFGKAPGHDLTEGKMTLPLIYSLGRCNEEEKKRMADIVAGKTLEAEDLAYAVALIRRSGGIDYSRRRADELVLGAKDRLVLFDQSPEKDALMELADYIVSRRS